ncbi:hypothetical protein [Lewinella sp. IMCC34183]|uniref:hypothetical protein n=1 Tax=Lewinella sp. IMCC34183 TaxID=2248762 RepID=UPI000E24E239|nr:hypothetical protein [Lewinella sp. IMCC34183]
MLTEEKSVEIVYAEYVRLHARIDALADSSFADFKLLGVAVPVLTAFISYLTANEAEESLSITPEMCLLLSIVLLSLVAIISFRDMLKLSLVNYYMIITADYEKQLREELGQETLFRSFTIWRGHFSANHSLLYTVFTVFFLAFLVAVPTYTLSHLNEHSYARIYGGLCAVVFIAHFLTMELLLRRPLDRLAEAYG